MSRRMGVLALTMAVAAALSAVTAATAGARQSAAFKVAWIYVGPHNDHGWSQAHDAGRLFVQKSLGSKVQTTFKELVPEGPQAAQVIDSLVRDGNKLIFATSFGYQDAMVAAAKKYPDVKFEQATGYKTAKNLAEYYGAGEDAIYLSGMAAGAATKKGVVGYVVPFAIPEVIRHTNAFALGVQATHPGATVKIVWTKSWLAPDKEKKAAESLHTSGGADVMGQNVDSPAAGQYSESVGIPWVGYDSDAQVVRAEVVADGRGLQLGPVLPQGARPRWTARGRPAPTGATSTTSSSRSRPSAPSVSAKTKAASPRRWRRSRTARSTSSRARSTTRAASSACPTGKKLTLNDMWR